MKSGVEFGAGFWIAHQHEEISHHLFQVPFWELLFGPFFIERSLLVLGVPTLRPPDLPRGSLVFLMVGFWVVERI